MSLSYFKGQALEKRTQNIATIFDQALQAETGLNTNLGLAFQQRNMLGLDQLGLFCECPFTRKLKTILTTGL